jgi:hypothetical protein
VTAAPDPNPQTPGQAGPTPPSADPIGATAGPGSIGHLAEPMSPTAQPTVATPLGKWLLIYTLLRVATLVVLTAVLALLMPLILALLFAVVLALPLSWVVFGGVRRRVNEAMAVKTASRRGERERLRAALDGREPE